MNPIRTLRAGALAFALVCAAGAAMPAAAQTGGVAGDVTGIARPLGTSTMQSLFPLTVPAEAAGDPAAAPSRGGPAGAPQGGVGGLGDRFRTLEVEAPRRENRQLIGLGNEHVYAVFGGMGFGAGFGGGIHLTTADKIPGVELYASALVTTRKYRQFDVGAFIPRLLEEGTHAEIRFRYLRRVRDNFYGIGPDVDIPVPVDEASGLPFGGFRPASSQDYETNYDLEQRQFSAVLEHGFGEIFQFGGYVDVTSSSTYEGEDDSDPPIGSLFAPTATPIGVAVFPPGVAVNFLPAPGLFTGSKILSEGIYAESDNRNTEDGLPKGYYLYGRIANSDGIGDDDPLLVALPFAVSGGGVTANFFAIGERDYGWVEAELDARAYIPLGSDRLSFAARYYSELKNPKGNSVIPFYHLARLGSGGTLRGFDTFRFHGNNSILLSGEIRATVRMIENDPQKGIDVYALVDAGQVWGIGTGKPESAPGNEFSSDNWEADAGGGVAVRFGKFQMRIELAQSNEETKFRLNFGTGF